MERRHKLTQGGGFLLLCLTALCDPSANLALAGASPSPVHDAYPAPILDAQENVPEEPYDDDLTTAIAEVYAANPELVALRYDQRAIDDDIGIALSQARPMVQLQVAGGYELILPGDITDAARPLSDRLNNPTIERDDLVSQLVVDQPLWTGGRVSTAVDAAEAASLAGQEALRGSEGDILFNLVVAYVDVRRDAAILAIRGRNVEMLGATVDEISARREAGELTRTDIAQGEVQYQSALVQLQVAEADFQASRASFAAIVGRAPGHLAPEPELSGLPTDIDQAFAVAEAANPELATAIARERLSRAQIAQARAEVLPQVSLRGTAGTNGPLSSFDRRDQDVTVSGRATISIPLSAGGRVRSQIAQAQNRNSADEARIEATRRDLYQGIIAAWNQWASAERNAAAQEAQLRSARIFYEGTYAEYREGLRSTFDVLFAQNSLREAQILLLSSRRDSYVARALLLRRMGGLEARHFLGEEGRYDPDNYARRVRNRSAVPWAPVVRTLDRIGRPDGERSPIEQLPVPGGRLPAIAPVSPPTEVTPQVLPSTRGGRQ